MPVPANFHGKKGRSGRKSVAVEIAKAQAIIRSWNKVCNEIDEKDVTEVALPLALKDMAQKIANPDGSNIIPPQLLVKIIDEQSTNTDNEHPTGVSEVV